MRSPSSAPAPIRLMWRCPASTTSRRFSSDGCSALIRAAFNMCISTTTLTSSPSGSIAADQKQEACSSTGSLSRPSPSDRPHTPRSSEKLRTPARSPHWSDGDTLLLEKLAHQFQRGMLVSLGLDQHVEDLAFGVGGAPEIEHSPVDFQIDLVKMPGRVRLTLPAVAIPRSGFV